MFRIALVNVATKWCDWSSKKIQNVITRSSCETSDFSLVIAKICQNGISIISLSIVSLDVHHITEEKICRFITTWKMLTKPSLGFKVFSIYPPGGVVQRTPDSGAGEVSPRCSSIALWRCSLLPPSGWGAAVWKRAPQHPQLPACLPWRLAHTTGGDRVPEVAQCGKKKWV